MQTLANGLVAGLQWSLLAAGFTLVFSTARFLHAAHAATFLVGGYASVQLSSLLPASHPVSFFVAGGVGAGLGCLIEVGVYRQLRSRQTTSLGLFVASLAVLLFVESGVSMVFGSEIRVVRKGPDPVVFTVLAARVTSWQAYASLVSLGSFAVLWVFLRRSTMGLRMRAIASSPSLSVVVGLDTNKTLLATAALSGFLAGLAGLLHAADLAISPSGAFQVLLYAATAAIIGGIGTLPGAFLGGLLVGLSQHLSVAAFSSRYQDLLVFLLLIAFLLIRPQGILGTAEAQRRLRSWTT